jgi:putative flippase GtrA
MPRWLRQFLSHETTPFLQFLKYALVGGMATATHIVVFYLCAVLLFPSLTPNDVVVRALGLSVAGVTETQRIWNAGIGNAIAFIFSNAFCYVLNRLFVFKPGRHPWAIEFLLFFGVSGISMLLGTSIQSWLIAQFSTQTTLAFGANLVTSLMINYAMRRFFIFKG